MQTKTNTLRQQFEEQALPLMQELYGQAYHLTRNRADAEDLVQETYIRGLRKFAQFEQGTNLKAWLSRILFNQFINDYRRSKRRVNEVHVEGADQMIGEESPVMEAYEFSHMEAAEIAQDQTFLESLDEELKGGLQEMDGRYRDVLLLNTVGNLSYRDIADKLKLPIGTVMSRLHRAKTFLRDRFAHRNVSFA
ncbi:MAG: sigma-70 family RNA polymerase sigma factor [Planctomycetes bacterium]|jgi:RNA polymerase sigma-70 factor (ECF subfamily)|nr:sigma-70 family RNA polymerase sigma factor [Planctomycetota bacterium]MCL4729522.1 sigma-70 family RNA polymerase sigma factor [Planctomycetota bacterium]